MNDFLQLIYSWYNKNKRELPWRQTMDPYSIWISEIILQQTRVDQGMVYYLKFTERFPTIHDLAAASENEVLKFWQGLGYYSRARNLHAAAKYIVNEHNGRFPQTYDEIISLKGVGPYTAAAISSIAFNLPFPALDGNVYRVLSRYFGISAPPFTAAGKKEFRKVAEEIMPAENCGLHNQALMEFGALQCVPQSPDCFTCMVASSCYANTHRMVAQFPAKTKKASQRTRYFYYFFLENENYIWLEKRTNNDIWKNLYQFPLIETETELADDEIAGIRLPFPQSGQFVVKSISPHFKHILSHQVIFARLFHLQTTLATYETKNHYIKVQKENLHQYPIPRLIDKLLKKMKESQI